jgi:hypothetical protein
MNQVPECSERACGNPPGEDGVLCEYHRFELSRQYHNESANISL